MPASDFVGRRRHIAMLIFNSLVQISSSSKGGNFLWTESLFPSLSRTWKLFNQVFRGRLTCCSGMNNFSKEPSPVDNSNVVKKLSTDFVFCRNFVS